MLESPSLAGALREIGRLRGKRPLPEWLRHTRNAELVVVLGEDIAALVGLVVAFAFLGPTVLSGDPLCDALGPIVIGVVLAAKIAMRRDLGIEDAVARINELERRLKAEAPQIGWCFIEPDLRDQWRNLIARHRE